MAEQKRENDGGQGKVFRSERSEDAYGDALGYAEAITATVREPLVVLDADMRVRTASRSFCQTFHVTPEETQLSQPLPARSRRESMNAGRGNHAFAAPLPRPRFRNGPRKHGAPPKKSPK